MNTFWQRFTALLTPGTRTLLVLLAAVYLAAVIGGVTHAFSLPAWLAASAPPFWHGQIWRVASYALLPNGILDFLMNGFALVLLGSQLERHWSRGRLWIFCAVATSGAGLSHVFLSSLPMVGAAPMMFGLLIAWAFECGHQPAQFLLFGEMTVRQIVLIFALVSLAIMFFTAGPAQTLVMAAGGLAGWLFLWLRNKWLMSRPSRAVESGRINRLEL
jgi:membrane associated rhomboid family serine protease